MTSRAPAPDLNEATALVSDEQCPAAIEVDVTIGAPNVFPLSINTGRQGGQMHGKGFTDLEEGGVQGTINQSSEIWGEPGSISTATPLLAM